MLHRRLWCSFYFCFHERVILMVISFSLLCLFIFSLSTLFPRILFFFFITVRISLVPLISLSKNKNTSIMHVYMCNYTTTGMIKSVYSVYSYITVHYEHRRQYRTKHTLIQTHKSYQQRVESVKIVETSCSC